MITRDDLVNRYGEDDIAGLERNIKDPDATVTRIADATRYINSYVSDYLPLATIPSSLKDACALVARYKLFKNKRPDDVNEDYKNLVLWLDKIAAGKLALIDDEGNVIDKTGDFYDTSFRSGAMVV
ncbi:DUF1320 domain-containing protein [Psychrobacter sp. ANT_WB68]|uniref:DUF1320 domain-containing protein n=1 Tax=Psychrobacter sp. ANT_WB68 TaxID=2597355 RepID=UPI0011F134C0|nr:DUF1320 domain-containing protein [Psychrobacter sp. ANT_WB68]KAA0915811.1 DUF1320 domain-containing protein [Psychrobacter sp. ANT_WB68]